LKNLLFIAAHPDDETFVAGGTIAKCVSEGGTVTLACGTRGERGKTAGLVPEDKLPQVREQELREAMAILGVSAIHFLGYTLGAPHQVKRLLWTAPIPPFPLHDLPEIAEIPAMPGADFMINIEPWAEKKKAALRAYRTQKLSIEPIFFEKPEAAHLFRTEVFRLAMGSRPATVPAHDLFVL
jgi:LmbE family N-acetylglucosaminyl deacetylase